MNSDIVIRTEIRSGDLGRIVSLHGKVYAPLAGFGLRFEAFVGRTIAEHILDNNARGQVWMVERGDELLGCIAVILRNSKTAQLRWLVLHPELRGQGIGRQLVENVLAYSQEQNCESVILETTDSLAASQSLYESFGFVVTSESIEELWDGKRPLIHMQLDLT